MNKTKQKFIASKGLDLNKITISFIFFIFKLLSTFRKTNKTVKIFIDIKIYTSK